tara:strand:+ start:223 stop:660 length:438 start_codon:yes stop_codon:yes gene_type:complete
MSKIIAKTSEKEFLFDNEEDLKLFLLHFFSKHCSLQKCNDLIKHEPECNEERFCEDYFQKTLETMKNIINYNRNGAYMFKGKTLPMEQFEGIFKSKLNECNLKRSLVMAIKKLLNQEDISHNDLQTIIQISPKAEFLPEINIFYR